MLCSATHSQNVSQKRRKSDIFTYDWGPVLDFDFPRFVYKFKLPKWAVAKVGRTKSQSFAIEFTLGLYRKSGRRAVHRTNTFRKLWSRRLKELLARQLWTLDTKGCQDPYHSDFDLKKFGLSFRRALCCRPAYLYYLRKKDHAINHQIRPCWRTKICPFCFANISMDQYRYVKGFVNKRLKKHGNHTDLVAVCRVVRQFVPAYGFDPRVGCEADQVTRMIPGLKTAIDQHRKAYTKLTRSKQISRKTLGTLWRIVVIPREMGWDVETRQFVLCDRTVKRTPVVKIRGAKTVYNASLRISRKGKPAEEFDDAFYELFGEFCRYPKTLLTASVELTATYLRAVHRTRLLTGTGVFTKTGRVLVKFFQSMAQEQKNEKARCEKEKDGAGTTETPVS